MKTRILDNIAQSLPMHLLREPQDSKQHHSSTDQG